MTGHEVADGAIQEQEYEPAGKLHDGGKNAVLLHTVVARELGFRRAHLSIEEKRHDAAPRIGPRQGLRTDGGGGEQCRTGAREDLLRGRFDRFFENAVAVAIDLEGQSQCQCARAREKIEAHAPSIARRHRDARKDVIASGAIRARKTYS